MIFQHPLERGAGKDAEFRLGQRGQGEVDIARIGLSEEVGGVEQADRLLAAVGGGGDQLQHARQQVATDHRLVACPGDGLAARDPAALADGVQGEQFPVVEAAAQGPVAHRAIGTDVVWDHGLAL